MKNIFLGMLTIALIAAPAAYAEGGKRKAKMKAKIEYKKDKCCDESKSCCKDECPPQPTCDSNK